VARLKPVGHDDRLSLVEHLDELRSRLIVSAVVFGIAFAACFWHDERILELANAPLGPNRTPVSLGVAEQFTTTLTVVAYAALIVAMPMLLYQLYAFVLPAFSPTERRVALPLLLMVPVLFVAGAVFGYFVVLPPAVSFLLGFNSEQFTTLVRAREYYSFASMSLLAVGLLFQTPVVILALTRLGITTPRQLRRHRRYAVLAIAIVAALLPSVDPVTMILTMVPLLLLYEGSILLATVLGHAAPAEALDEDEERPDGEPPDAPPGSSDAPPGSMLPAERFN
jgi:sec-independent protein translocase protein TatC